MRIEKRFSMVIRYFLETQPIAETELVYKSSYELAVAVILSAQCTDKRVNMITPEFFKWFPDAVTLSKAKPYEVLNLIKSCSYPNNKTRNLIGMAKVLIADYQGVMPSDIEDLQKLPGVGRKTANVIAAVIYNKPTMAVDTHVHRVAARIGLTRNATTPLKTEQQLVKHIPQKLIPLSHHWLILHGRYICQARKPKCSECGITSLCKFYENQKKSKSC